MFCDVTSVNKGGHFITKLSTYKFKTWDLVAFHNKNKDISLITNRRQSVSSSGNVGGVKQLEQTVDPELPLLLWSSSVSAAWASHEHDATQITAVDEVSEDFFSCLIERSKFCDSRAEWESRVVLSSVFRGVYGRRDAELRSHPYGGYASRCSEMQYAG